MNGGFDESVGPQGARACPACGARVRREAARFCRTCGRDLVRGGDYFPSDTLRASYHMQRAGRDGAGADRASGRAGVNAGCANVGAARPHRRTHGTRRRPLPPPAARAPRADGTPTSALAFVTYSLVPYLGILFCPGALVAGGLGLARARRDSRPGGARTSVVRLGIVVAVTGTQIFLWWILYKIPGWVGRF